MKPPDDLPRDLTDRVFGKTLENVHNLQEFLQEALPEHVAALDCLHARLLPREFIANDWRGREADLFFEIPYRGPNGVDQALVCLLLEHQTKTDVLMPFRTLGLTVAFWDRQWRDWQALSPPRPELRFTPVIPIVLYTGPTPWGSTRRMTELLAEPAVFHSFAPASEPLFWSLAEHSAEELLSRGGVWHNLLAVIRSERADADTFHQVALGAIQHLYSMDAADRPRWEELIRAVLAWTFHHRPVTEHASLTTGAEALLSDPIRKQEFHTMAEQTVDYLYGRGRRQGREEGREEGLSSMRVALQEQLKHRFGLLPEAVRQRIAASTSLDKLQLALIKVFDMKTLDDLAL
jgi:hypothetical protein